MTVSGEVGYKGLISDVIDFASDETMIESVGADRYKLLSATEKMELKEIDNIDKALIGWADKMSNSDTADTFNTKCLSMTTKYELICSL